MNNRLKTITSKTNGNVYRSYDLTYNTTGDGTEFKFSRLISVTEKNGQNEALPAVQLNWSYLPEATNYANTVSVEEPNVDSHYVSFSFPDHHLLSGDMNNDGITDIVGLQNVEVTKNGIKELRTYVNVYESQKTSSGVVSFNKGRLYNLDPSFAYGKYYSGLGSISTLDIDGDGKNEFIIPYFTKINNDRSVTFVLLRREGNGDIISYALPIRHESMPQFATGDLDRDGKDEIIYAEYANNGIILNVMKYNSGTFTRLQIECPSTDYPNHLYVADMNGNGLNDIVTIPSYGYKIFWNQGGQTIDDCFNGQNTSSQPQADADINNMFYLGDFNGDGLPDFLANSHENWFFYVNNGNGGFKKQWACALTGIFDQSFTPNDDDKYHCEVLDFDNDGKTDIIVTKADYERKRKKIMGIEYGPVWGEFLKTYTFWLRSTGTSLVEVHRATSNRENDAYDRKFITGDFDGDGRVELMNYGYDCSHGENANSDPTWNIYKSSGLNDKSGKVTSIKGNYGAYTYITYSNLTDPSVYTLGNETSYPAPKITLPLNVVKSVFQNNGAAGGFTTEYTYSGLRVHLNGRGLLGFTSTQKTNNTFGITEKSEVLGWNSTYYLPSSTKVTTTIGGKTSYVQNSINYINKGGVKYYANPYRTVEKDLDGNTITTTRTYDPTNGYLTSETISYGSNSNNYKIVEYSGYIKAGNVYKPQTVITTQSHEDDESEYTNTTLYTYNTWAGYLMSVTTNAGTSQAVTTSYTYNMFGNLKSEVRIADGITNFSTLYDYDGTQRFPEKIYTNPSTSVRRYSYDIWGNVLTERDSINTSINNTITHTYDNWGNLVRTQIPGAGEVKYTTGWGRSSDKRFFVLEQGTSRPWVKTWYDNQGRVVLTESIGPKNVAINTTITYDNKGLKTSESETTGNLSLSHTYEYDDRGRIWHESHPGNRVVFYAYGGDGRSTTITENNKSTTYRYDAMGNLKKVEGPLSNVITYEYSSNGKPKKTVANGATWEMEYDDCGNQTKLIDPDAGITQFTYDALGREIQRIDGRGVVFATNYDNLGRVTSRSADYDVVHYNYGTSGTGQLRLVSESNFLWTKYYEYDQYGRLTGETLDRGQGGFTRSKSYQYNAAGLLSSRLYPDDRKVSYTYDSYGNCATISAGTSSYNYLTWTLTGYNGKTMTSSVNAGGGYPYVRTTQLDNNGQLQSLVLKRQNTTLKSDSYTFDGQTGNLLSRTVNGVPQSFSYDGADRLTGVTTGQNQVSMTYSVNGNITSKSDFGQYSYNNTRPHAVAEVDRGGSIPYHDQWLDYDKWGKIVAVEYSKGNDFYYYDIEYGPDQQRTISNLTSGDGMVYSKFIWDEYEEYYVDGNSYIYYWIEAPDGLAGMLMYNSEDFYHPIHPYVAMTDHLGSLTALYDENTNKVHEASYDAWGKRTLGQVSMPLVTRGFTGHEHLDELDLINMNGRMYDPNMGRFLNPDPYVQSPSNPQNYNRYSYCLNNPLKYYDPSGEFFTWSIYKGGISFGFNFTPVNVPLGFGFNIGYGDGLSLGFYAELGYRVGGTGFGSGFYLQESFDYNFKNSSWSATTSFGVYASYGMLSAGTSFSSTYDYGSKEWSDVGWIVSAGLAFGDDQFGWGATVSYGSNGLSWGIGGYYYDNAWESNPEYDPDFWNEELDKNIPNNCYSYMLDEPYRGAEDRNKCLAGGKIIDDYPLSVDEVLKAAISDGRIKKPNFFNKLGFGKKGYYRGYLVVGYDDYHWYRQDKGGTWSSKHGFHNEVNQLDGFNHPIKNPVDASHNYLLVNYNRGGTEVWIRGK